MPERPNKGGRTLDERYAIELFADCEIGVEDVIDLWVREGAMALEVAEKRVAQVLFVALERESGSLAGLCTAYLAHLDRLRLDLWHYRTFVGSLHREAEIARHLLYATLDRLERRFVSGEDRRGRGLLFSVENELLKRARNEAVWPNTRAAYIGDGPAGAHIRVRYFDGALAPPADRQQRRPAASA